MWFGSECETTVPYDYGVLEEFEPTIPDDYIAMRDRETIGQTYQQATQIHWPHEYTGHTNSSAERSNRPHESIGQTDRSLRPTFRPDESKEHCSEFPHDSEIEKYIGASITEAKEVAGAVIRVIKLIWETQKKKLCVNLGSKLTVTLLS
ncbi:hypothetical protein EG327_001662 [Venturia inaequalis]|uniref:Uncharacterized protein n=1 Tax=Venturia inaequalis TaxID=5025 RepID=A0A8H3Z8P4_VENIN|nr:hypothetical protein EG327_001662 [Venturia inaequalis]